MKINKFCRRIISTALTVVAAASSLFCTAPVIVSALNIPSIATLTAMSNDYYTIDTDNADIPSFCDYYNLYSDKNRPDKTIEIKAENYISAENGIFKTGRASIGDVSKDNVLIWESSKGEIAYNINVEESGIYCVNIIYCALKSNRTTIELSMKIDGETPYDTASRISLNKVWVSERELYKDAKGNQVRSSQIQKEMWQSCDFGDSDGLFSEPLFFYLEKGDHEISFYSERAELAIDTIKFYNPQKLSSYAEYTSSVGFGVTKEDTPSRLFRIEGESASYKSSISLYPTYDNTNYLISPSDPTKVVYNTIGGGGSWKEPLQSVTWTISKNAIGNAGWYKIGIKARQDQMRGFRSNRRIYLDDEVICEEMNQLEFDYDKDWSVFSPKSDGEYIYVYLDSNFDHTLTLENVAGEIGGYLISLDDVIEEVNVYYRKILMITGPNPDKYTDYYVHEKIPELLDKFEQLSDELKFLQAQIESITGNKGSEAAIIERMTVILDKCIDKPLKIPMYLSQIKENITSISAWTKEYRNQPLEIDYIEFASMDRDFTSCKKNLIKSAGFSLKSFIGSFFEDYTTLSDVTDEESLEVWVDLGREQAQIVKELTENQFMQEYGIPISINLVSGGVVEATLAGKGPDIALFLGGEFPVNLAARGLLVDCSEFSDYTEVSERFQENAMTQYTYNDGVYGIPISQSWPMMFYRTDILTEIGYNSPPKTWDELKNMLPAIQRNYMSVGLVLPETNVSPATEIGHTFAMLLLQNGGNYYNDDLSESTLNSTLSVQAFEQWTNFYTQYGFVQSYDTFSRFRTGEFPIVIADYTFANKLSYASPEIKGLWNFCQVPGTVREDGTISHAANSMGTGAVIFNKASNKENAWKFVKWFTDADIQAEYGAQIEGLLGTMGRFDTANLEALERISWSEDEFERLRAQQNSLVEIPVTPSSYAVTRGIMNAFREVVNEMENPRDTLIWYNKDINEEIERKRENLGLEN